MSGYLPHPGTEYAYPISDFAYAAAHALGDHWAAESGFLGGWGEIHTLDDRVTLRLFVDNGGDLCIEDYDDARPVWGRHVVPTTSLPDRPPHTPQELRQWGEAIAAAVRAATRRHKLTTDLDM